MIDWLIGFGIGYLVYKKMENDNKRNERQNKRAGNKNSRIAKASYAAGRFDERRKLKRNKHGGK